MNESINQWRRNEFESGGHRSGAKVGAPIRREATEKNFVGRDLPRFSSEAQFGLFGERFRDGQHSLVSFLFAVLLLMVPPPRAQPFVTVGAPWSRRYWNE